MARAVHEAALVPHPLVVQAQPPAAVREAIGVALALVRARVRGVGTVALVVPVAGAAGGHGRESRPSGSRWTPTSRAPRGARLTSGVPTADARRRKRRCHLFVGAKRDEVQSVNARADVFSLVVVDRGSAKHGSGRRPRPQQAHGAAETREGVPQPETRSGVSRGGAFAGPPRVLQRAVGVPSESGTRANRIVKRSFYLRVSRDGARGRRRTQGPARGPEHAMRRPAAHSRRKECVPASRRASGGPSTRRSRPRPPFRRDRRNARRPSSSRLVPTLTPAVPTPPPETPQARAAT